MKTRGNRPYRLTASVPVIPLALMVVGTTPGLQAAAAKSKEYIDPGSRIQYPVSIF
jgi:hypothetical protein